MKRRNGPDDTKTGLQRSARDQLGGYLPTAQVVSGVKVARAWSWVLHGTCEADPAMSSLALAGEGTGEAQVAKTARARVPLAGSVAGRSE